MNDLQKQTGDNIGGYNELMIVDVDHVSSIPEHVDHVISGNIQLTSDWVNVAFSPKSIRLTGGEIDDEKGNAFNPQITFFHAKDNDQSLTWFEYYKQKNLVVKLKDNNGNYKIIGNPDTPLRLKYKLVSNSNYDSRPGYEVTIFGFSLLPALYFTGDTIIDSGSGSGSAS